MGVLNRKRHDVAEVSLSPQSSPIDGEKHGSENRADAPAQPDDMKDPHTHLQRGLKARQVAMIAIGGAM